MIIFDIDEELSMSEWGDDHSYEYIYGILFTK